MTTARKSYGAPRAILGPAIDLARASTLVARQLTAPSTAALAMMLLPALIQLARARTPDDSAGIMRALWISWFCTGMSVGTSGLMQSTRAETLAFLETRPLRVSTKVIVTLPFMVIAAIFVAFVSALGHWELAKASAVFGCAWWAIDLAVIVPHPPSKNLAFLGLGTLGILTACFGYAAGGWNGATIAIVPLAAIGWFAAPSRNAWRTGQLSREGSVAATTPVAASRSRKTSTTAVDVLVLALCGRDRKIGPLVLLQILLASGVFAASLVDHKLSTLACCFWFMLITMNSFLFAAALSRPSLEFLATRPLGARRLIVGLVLPWLMTVCTLPLLTLGWSQHGFVRLGAYRISAASFVLRLILVAVGFLFCVSHDALRGPRARIPLLNVGLYLLLAPLVLPWLCPIEIHGLPWWLPPTWLVAGYALVIATLWVRRMPWHLLSPAR